MPLNPPEKQHEDAPPPPLEGVGTVDSSDHDEAADDGVGSHARSSPRSFGASVTTTGGGGASPMPGLPSAPPSVVNRVMDTVFLDNGVEVEGANTLRNMALVALALGISGAEPDDSPLRIISDEVAQEPRVAKALRLVEQQQPQSRRNGCSSVTPSMSRATSVHSQQTVGGSMTTCGDVITALDSTATQDGYFETMNRLIAARRAKDAEIRDAAAHAEDTAREQELTDAMKRSVSNVFVPSSRRKSARSVRGRAGRSASTGSRQQSEPASPGQGAVTTPSSAGGVSPGGRKPNRASGYWGPVGKGGPGDDSLESAPGGLGFSSGRRQTKNALRDLAKSVIARQLPDYMPVTCGHCKVSNAAPAATQVRPVDARDAAEGSASAHSRSMRGMMAELTGDVSTSAAAARAANGPGGALPHSARGPDVVYPVALGLADEDTVEGRLWRLLAAAEWPEFDPESHVDRQPLTKQRKAALLASHFQSRIGVPPWAEFFYKKKREEADAVRRQVAYQQASSRRLAEFQSRSAATKLEITALEKALSVRDPVEHAAQVEVALSALQKDLDQLEQLNLSQEAELASHRKYGARYKERITLELEEMRRCLRFLGRLHDIARDGANQAHIPGTVMAKDAIAELILPILERYPSLAMNGQHDLDDDDGGELDFDPLGHQCPDCLLLKSSSPYCTVSGRKHQESMPVDARPLDQAELDRLAMDQSRADLDAAGKGGGDDTERRRKRRRRRQRQLKRAARKRSSAAAKSDADGSGGSDGDAASDDGESLSGSSTTSASTASHVSDTTTDAGADSDASSETWDRRDHRRRRRQRLLRNILARGRKDTAVPKEDGKEASGLQGSKSASGKPGGKKSKKMKAVVPGGGLAGVVGAVMGKAKVRSRYLDPPGARRNAQAGRRDGGGDEGAGVPGANTLEQIMTGLESVLVDAFGTDVLHDASASSSKHGASEKQHNSQFHSKRGSTNATPKSGGKGSQPLSAATSPQRSPGGEHLSLPAHATATNTEGAAEAAVAFPNNNSTDSDGLAKKDDTTAAIPAVKTPPDYQAPDGEEAAARHCRDFMDAVAARNVGVMRTIANRGMDESAMNPSTSAAVFRHQLHEQEAQFCEWFSLMLLRTQDAKVAASKLKMKNEISAATTVAQSEAEIRSLRKELRNLNYSFDKRPKGRSAGASLDDSAFKGLVGRIGELEKRHLHLRTRIKYAVSERHIIENKHAGLAKPGASGHGGGGGEHSANQQTPQGPQGQMGNSSRSVTSPTSPMSRDGA